MSITNILGMRVQVKIVDGRLVDMRPASEFDNGKVIDGNARRVESDEGKKMVAHQKPSSDLEE